MFNDLKTTRLSFNLDIYVEYPISNFLEKNIHLIIYSRGGGVRLKYHILCLRWNTWFTPNTPRI